MTVINNTQGWEGYNPFERAAILRSYGVSFEDSTVLCGFADASYVVVRINALGHNLTSVDLNGPNYGWWLYLPWHGDKVEDFLSFAPFVVKIRGHGAVNMSIGHGFDSTAHLSARIVVSPKCRAGRLYVNSHPLFLTQEVVNKIQQKVVDLLSKTEEGHPFVESCVKILRALANTPVYSEED